MDCLLGRRRAGTHEELLKIQVKKNKDGTPIQGYYHVQWDTQMGEESFGSAEHMNGEQLDGREKYFEAEIEKLQKERGTRGTD